VDLFLTVFEVLGEAGALGRLLAFLPYVRVNLTDSVGYIEYAARGKATDIFRFLLLRLRLSGRLVLLFIFLLWFCLRFFLFHRL
jgi:hypothetical protein